LVRTPVPYLPELNSIKWLSELNDSVISRVVLGHNEPTQMSNTYTILNLPSATGIKFVDVRE